VTRFILQRAFWGFVVVMSVITLVFFLIFVAGDPAVTILGPQARAEQIADFKAKKGLDQPVVEQFLSYLGIMLSPATEMSLGLVAIIAAWFAASWYLFRRLMQRLLFGPHRTDLRYEDLRPGEIAVFVLVIALLLLPGNIPRQWLDAGVTEVSSTNGKAS